MKISVFCSSQKHPIYPFLEKWCFDKGLQHLVELKTSKNDLSGGDLLFLVSCSEIINSLIRDRYKKTLIIHASDLPTGRGWSPLVWQILEGQKNITVTLLEAEDKVDSGVIWHQEIIYFKGHELFDEINNSLFQAELHLMDYAIDNFHTVQSRPQPQRAATYYRKRTPEDSYFDPKRSLIEQFNLLRIADPERYPAYFYHLGYCYEILIRKQQSNENGSES